MFPFVIEGEVKTTGYDSGQAVLEKLARSMKREGATNVAINGDVLDFSGITGQLSASPLVNIDRSSVTISHEANSIRLKYVLRPDSWAAYAAAIVIAIGLVTWLFSIFPIQFPAGAGLVMLVVWLCYVPIIRFRYESFLRRSISF